MLGVQLQGYDEFRSIFGTRRSDRGTLVNKVLLNFWKYRYQIDGDFRAMQIRNMQDLYNLVFKQLEYTGLYNSSCNGNVGYLKLNEKAYRFRTGDLQLRSYGINTNDLSGKTVAYVDKFGKPHEMNAGKFFRHLIKAAGARLDESTITYCSEEFQRRWEACYNVNEDRYKLNVSPHKFGTIYAAENNTFGSCMTGKGQYHFYERAVKASAAYLVDEHTQRVVARCVVFHGVKVVGDDSRTYNYAERQYSDFSKEILKRILIKKLIDAGIIQLYKTIGAGCRDTTAIVDVHGVRIPNTSLCIPCNLKYGNTTSFQDTFAYYSPEKGYAYNTRLFSSNMYELGHTNSSYRGHDSQIQHKFDYSDVKIIENGVIKDTV